MKLGLGWNPLGFSWTDMLGVVSSEPVLFMLSEVFCISSKQTLLPQVRFYMFLKTQPIWTYEKESLCVEQKIHPYLWFSRWKKVNKTANKHSLHPGETTQTDATFTNISLFSNHSLVLWGTVPESLVSLTLVCFLPWYQMQHKFSISEYLSWGDHFQWPRSNSCEEDKRYEQFSPKRWNDENRTRCKAVERQKARLALEGATRRMDAQIAQSMTNRRIRPGARWSNSLLLRIVSSRIAEWILSGCIQTLLFFSCITRSEGEDPGSDQRHDHIRGRHGSHKESLMIRKVISSENSHWTKDPVIGVTKHEW